MDRLRVVSCAVVACVFAAAAAPVLAQNFIWIDAPPPGDGNHLWFDGTNWDLGTFPPAATGNAFINNGGTAVANVLGALGVQDLTVGLSDGVTGGSGGSGTVEGSATNTAIGRDLFVGQIRGIGNGSLLGTLDLSSTITLGRDMFVGHLDGGAPGSSVTGLVDVGGSNGANSSLLRIGFIDSSAAGSTAQGTVNATSLSGFELIDVGSNRSAVGSVVDSRLEVSGNMTTSNLGFATGISTGGGDAQGTVTAGDLDLTTLILSVGTLRDGSGTVSGSVTDTGGTGMVKLVGQAGGGANHRVGASLETGAGNVTGSMDIGSLVGDSDAVLQIGIIDSPVGGGTVQGTVKAASFSGFEVLSVGTNASAVGSVVDSRLEVSGNMTTSNLGFATGISTGGGDAQGTVTAGDLDLTTLILSVGTLRDGSGTVSGSVTDTGGTGMVKLVGQAGGGATHHIGASLGTSKGNATGSVHIGSLMGDSDADLRIGFVEMDAGGVADGTLEAAGTVSARQVLVGVNSGTGAATGRLILHDDMVATSMLVGRNLSGGGGPVIGEVTLDNAILTVEQVVLGEGSDVLFHIDGLLRGDEYGAIDGDIVTLFDQPGESIAQAMFNFTPSMGTHHFDLITAPFGPQGLGGIVGTFSDFDVFGLDPEFKWSTEHVFENQHEIFRLTITSNIPEPMTGALGLMGLGALSAAARRRRTA